MHALALLLVLPAAWHQLPDGYGTPERVVVRGRAMDGAPLVAGNNDDSALDNLASNLNTLETDELPGVVIEVELAGERVRVRADDDGLWEAEVRPKHPLTVGTHDAIVRMVEPKGPSGRARVYVVDKDATAIISDFDDTVVETGVKSKRELLKNALLKNETQLEPVPGAALAYANATTKAANIFFVSGSPLAYHDRILRFLERHKLPRGPIFLKNLGDTSMTEQDGYKTQRIEALLKALPGVRFLLVGDSGERDPEIYAGIQTRFPARVVAVVIRKVKGDLSPSERFEKMTVVDDYQDADVLRRLLTSSETAPRKLGPSSRPQ